MILLENSRLCKSGDKQAAGIWLSTPMQHYIGNSRHLCLSLTYGSHLGEPWLGAEKQLQLEFWKSGNPPPQQVLHGSGPLGFFVPREILLKNFPEFLTFQNMTVMMFGLPIYWVRSTGLEGRICLGYQLLSETRNQALSPTG